MGFGPNTGSGLREAGAGVDLAVGRRQGRRPRFGRSAGRSFAMTFIAVVVVSAFLSPLAHSFFVSIKSPTQLADQNAPLVPSSPATFTYQGQSYDEYRVPLPGTGTK